MIDGVIKYTFDFQQTEPLKHEQFTEIESLRKRLFALNLIGVTDEGIGFGNISQRVGRDSFVITGTQTGHLAKLQGEHYALIEAYNDKEFYLKSSGAIKPSSEALTHGTIYNLSFDISAVIHIHSKVIWNFMLKNNYLKTEDVAYGTKEMIDEVNRIFSTIEPLSNPKFVMLGHEDGVIIFGTDLLSAELILYEMLKKVVNA
ncbi:MAG: class II aldolase/adducin family protein [Sulfurovum sp.]|nr:MAG: class II aldolase/adducin family protein [Sulfurovum sp.]